MLLQAQQELDLDLANSFVIGDKDVDVGAAYAAGAKPVLVLTGYGRETERPRFVAENLMEAVDKILSGEFS